MEFLHSNNTIGRFQTFKSNMNSLQNVLWKIVFFCTIVSNKLKKYQLWWLCCLALMISLKYMKDLKVNKKYNANLMNIWVLNVKTATIQKRRLNYYNFTIKKKKPVLKSIKWLLEDKSKPTCCLSIIWFENYHFFISYL